MTVVRKIQTSFSSGELSPSLYSRVDLNRYNTGLRKCKNFIVHPHGGVSNRAGTKHVAETKDSTKKSRLVKHIFSETQAYQLEFGDEYVRFFRNHGQLGLTIADTDAWTTPTAYVVGDFVDNGGLVYYCIVAHTSGTFATDLAAGKWVQQSIYEVPTPYAGADIFDLKFERSADVLYIFHKDYKTRTLSRYGDTDWRVAEYESEDGPFMSENISTALTMAVSAVTGTAVDVTTVGSILDDDHVNALFKMVHYIPGQVATTAFTSTASSTEISCFTTWRLISHGTWTGKIRVEKSTDNGSTWTALRDFSSGDDFNINTYGTEDIEANPYPFLVRCTCYSYTSGTANVDLTTDNYFNTGIIKMLTVASATAGTAEVLTAVGTTAATVAWSEGAWSTYRGFPSVGAFNEDRLCFAATEDEPMNIWMTRTGNYESFGVSSTLLATDAINIKLLARQLNAVNNLISLGDLAAMSTGSEWKIGADRTTLTPSTVYARPQSYRGTSDVTPAIIGNQMIYVQANGTVVRNYSYDYSSDSYTGSDLRILSEHLFNNYNIVEMDYQQDPNSIVWIIRDDGIMLSLTYMEEQDVIAWSWHETEGDIESVSVIPQDGYDEVWMTVNRDGGIFVEYMEQRLTSTDPSDQYYVDCGLQYDNSITDITGITAATPPVVTTTADHGLSDGDLIDIEGVVGMTELNGNRYKVANKAAKTFELTEEDTGDDIVGADYTAYVSGAEVRKCYSTFSGLSHLEGQTVAILGNGEVYPQQVVASGEITISRACSKISVGLPYTSDFETLNVEMPIKTGTLQGRPVKIANVTFRLLSSRGGWIGPNEDTLYEAFTPERLSLGTAPLLFSGDVREGLGAGYESGGRIFYRQVDPLPVTISAVIPELVAY